MSSITAANNGAAFLQAVQSSGNWLQDTATADAAGSADWMDPSSSGPDAVDLAANAFASAQQVKNTNLNSLAVNQGISTLEAELANQTLVAGQSVNILA